MQTPSADHDALPLTEATFCIMLSLAAGPRHGYAIMQEVASLSDDRVRLSTGTLYGALKRLLDQGWIEPTPVGPPASGAREIRVYKLSERGRQIFLAEQERMRALLRAANARLTEEML